jgi:hypothetical protein
MSNADLAAIPPATKARAASPNPIRVNDMVHASFVLSHQAN